MNGLWRWLALLLCVVMSHSLADTFNHPETEAPGAATSPTETLERQLLVMLHMPPPHFRPSSNYSGRYSDDAGRGARRRIAQDIGRRHKLKLVSNWPMPAIGVDCYVMEAPAGESLTRIIDVLSNDSRVEWVQGMGVFHGLAISDPLYPLQPSAKYWHLAEIHKVATGRNVGVAIIDSGVDDNHPDLTGQVTLKENFIDGNPYVAETHGTAVAGIIGARAGNGIGIEGVASGAHLMAMRACWQETENQTRCNSFTLGKALSFAILHKAQVINMSLAGPPDRLLQHLLEAALVQGIAIVAAADPHQADGGFPASFPGTFAVADEDFKRSGARLLVAPGRDIPTTAPGKRWNIVNGASYAAAHVSGMLALLIELKPALRPAQLRQELVFSPLASIDGRSAGAVDVCATVAKLSGSCPCLCTAANASKATY